MYFSTWEEQNTFPDQIDSELLKQTLKESFVTCFGTETYSDATRLDRILIAALFSNVVNGHLGLWSKGWSGDMVSSWCCPQHSVFAGSDKSLDDTFNRIVQSVEQWLAVLKEARCLFEALADQSSGLAIQTMTERATGPLVNFVLKHNGADDAWFGTFVMFLGWYLESIDADMRSVIDSIDEIVEGHFESWIAPTKEATEAVAVALGEAVLKIQPDFSDVDTTGLWVGSRRLTLNYGEPFYPNGGIREDNHLRFVEEFDVSRSPERGDAMRKALLQCRIDAKSEQQLDWEMLCRWQAIVLQSEGESISFRSGDAFAKQGREYYPLKPATPKQFKKYLVECNDLGRCALARAANVYGDICFFHPFNDGNARAARLAFEYVLAKQGLAIRLPRALFSFPRSPHDMYYFVGTMRTVIGRREF